jgi:RNA polymerase sigma-70 factor (ECF subfamily)
VRHDLPRRDDRDALAALYRTEHARVLASVLARVGDFPLAEESVQDAFVAAAQWGEDQPPNPRAWLIRVASNKALDRLRRRARFPEIGEDALASIAAHPAPQPDAEIGDERLRLIFTCCHPALAPEAQVALTLRTVAGLRTEEIARLFFAEPAAMAQRLVARNARSATRASLTWCRGRRHLPSVSPQCWQLSTWCSPRVMRRAAVTGRFAQSCATRRSGSAG